MDTALRDKEIAFPHGQMDSCKVNSHQYVPHHSLAPSSHDSVSNQLDSLTFYFSPLYFSLCFPAR